jgi:ubiquinone/menaquinone biosynthesis C-methylase UbiE
MEGDLWRSLYVDHADHYERLVTHEDYQGNLMAALQRLHPLEGSEVVELGAGTGRITLQLLPRVWRLLAFDLTPSMLRIAQEKIMKSGRTNGLAPLADSRALPVPAACTDLAVEGWSLVQIAVWHASDWRAQLGRAIDEMLRVVRPGGTVALIETLGTGAAQPDPPEAFTLYYDYLERERGFRGDWVRTDYRFESREQAAEIIAPVFGEAVLEKLVQSERGVILPECSGLWWRRK